MSVDLASAAMLASIAMLSTGLIFVATGLSSRYASTGARLWGLAYVLMLVALSSNLVTAYATTSGWGLTWALALGNGAGVGFIGCLLLGVRAYNRRDVQGPALMVTAVSVLSVAASLFDGPQLDLSAGETVTYLGLSGLAATAALHAVLGASRRFSFAWVFAFGLGVQAIFYLVRVVLILTIGMDDPVYIALVGPVPWYILTVSATLVTTIAAFVLRALLGTDTSAPTADAAGDAVLSAGDYLVALRRVLRRASGRTELVVVIAVLVEDVGTITASFGQEVADATTRVLRAAVREFASPVSDVGRSPDRTIVLVTTTASSPADARRQAGLLYRGVVQRFVAARGIVVPGVGVGVALSSTLGYTAETLVEGATIAAVEASESDETSVVFATGRTLPTNPFPADVETA